MWSTKAITTITKQKMKEMPRKASIYRAPEVIKLVREFKALFEISPTMASAMSKITAKMPRPFKLPTMSAPLSSIWLAIIIARTMKTHQSTLLKLDVLKIIPIMLQIKPR